MYRIRLVGEASVIEVRGDLDFTSSKALGTLISRIESTSNRVVVSLTDCVFCDASGLTVLLRTFQRIGTRMCIVLPDAPGPRRLFELTGLSALIPIALDEEEALSSSPCASGGLDRIEQTTKPFLSDVVTLAR